MPKGVEHKRDQRKKPAHSLKEKRMLKKEKKMKHQQEHMINPIE